MKTRRILSALIVALMILPLAIIGVGADAPATAEYFTPATDNPAGTKATVVPNYDNNYYQVSMTRADVGGTWKGAHYDIVTAETLAAGVVGGKYTIEFDFQWLAPMHDDHLYFYFGGTSNSHTAGNMLYLRGSAQNSVQLEDYGVSHNKSANAFLEPGFNTIKFVVDTMSESVVCYLNGVLFSNESGMATASNALGAIGFRMGNGGGSGPVTVAVAFDNIKVTSGDNVIFSENYEGETINEFTPAADHAAGTKTAVITPAANNVNSYRISMKKSEVGGTWKSAHYDIVTAETLAAGVVGGKYTIEFDFKWDLVMNGDHMYFYFGGTDNSHTSGNMLYIKGTAQGTTQLQDIGASQNVSSTGNLQPGFNSFKFVVDTMTESVVCYLNGALFSSETGIATGSNNLGPIGFKMGNGGGSSGEFVAVSFDNIKITSGENVIYSEDFEPKAPVAPVTYYGAQAALNTNGLRFVGVLADEYTAETIKDLKAVGFHITATYEGGEKVFDTPCTKIFNKLNGTVSGNTETYTAEALGGKHIFALTIKDIPAEAGVVTFVVTPYFTTAEGETVGATWTVVYDAANNTIVSQTKN